MLTIDEAAKQWKCSKNTVLSYIYKEYIVGIREEEGRLLLPEIPRPYIPRRCLDGTLDYYKVLLRVVQREQFIDEHILKISREKFHGYIDELENVGYIKMIESNSGIAGYILTTRGNDELKKKGKISLVNDLTVQPQIGLINIQNSASGSFI